MELLINCLTNSGQHVDSEVAKVKIGHAILTCAGNNISIGDPLHLRSTYNDIGTLLNGKLYIH